MLLEVRLCRVAVLLVMSDINLFVSAKDDIVRLNAMCMIFCATMDWFPGCAGVAARLPRNEPHRPSFCSC